MSLTMPQIVLFNHAAGYNYRRMEARSKAKSKAKQTNNERDPIVMGGKRLSQLSDKERDIYLSNWSF